MARHNSIAFLLVVISSFMLGTEGQGIGATTPRTITLDLAAIFKLFNALLQSPIGNSNPVTPTTSEGKHEGVTNPLVAGELDAMFERIATVDKRQCIPRLLCKLYAADGKRRLTNLERLIVTLFQNYKSSSGFGSAASIYETAVTMGKGLRMSNVCIDVFPSCLHTSEQLFQALSQ